MPTIAQTISADDRAILRSLMAKQVRAQMAGQMGQLRGMLGVLQATVPSYMRQALEDSVSAFDRWTVEEKAVCGCKD